MSPRLRVFASLMREGWFAFAVIVGLAALPVFVYGMGQDSLPVMTASIGLSMLACGAMIRSWHLDLVRERQRTSQTPLRVMLLDVRTGQMHDLDDLITGGTLHHDLDDDQIDEHCAAMADFLDDVDPTDFARR